MPGKLNKVGQTANATFIFRGTVKKLRSASMKSVPVDDRTAIVRVDQVIEAPKSLAAFAGQDITVQLAGRKKISAGDELVFHAEGWIFGDSIAVQSVNQEPAKESHALSRSGDPVQHHADRRLRERFDDADVIVSGRVSAVRLPAEETHRGLRALRASETHKPVSEHDPKWREAVVEIDDVHKGSIKKKQVVVHFPSSTDVRWYKAPKFHPGQQGFFMLHKTKIKKASPKAAGLRAAAKAAAPAMEEFEGYTALHPADFHPIADPHGMAALIEANPKAGTGKARS
jgi:hypothetical protein